MANNGDSNETICLVCNSSLENASCINIFCTSLSRNEELLASFVLGVIHPSALELNSNYICTQCYNLFQMLEQARWTATNIENEILKIYQSSRDKRRLINDRIVNTTVNADVSENELFINNSNLEEKSDISNNLHQYVHIQSIESLNNGCNSTRKNMPKIIEDKHITNSQIIKTPLINLSPDNSNPIINNKNDKTSISLIPNSLNEIRNHNQEKTEKIPIHIHRCKICTKLFESVNDLNEHLSKHEVLYLYKCEECQKQFTNLSDANSHSLTFHGEKDSIEFTNQQDCVDHENNPKILNDIITDNETCGPSIVHNDLENQNSVNDITSSKCDEVNKTNKNNNNTQSSKTVKKSKCNSKPLNYSCPTCGKMWKSSSELKSHIKTHSSVRPYMCEKCGQAYKHKHALEIHIGMHNGINPFQCDFCNKCFTQKGALMRHLPIHTGEMPYQCEICGKRFVHHTSYNMHTLSHTGKKTHQCPNCDLLLLSTSHLKRHMRVHTGEKPYSCPSCGKRFAERYNLYAHQKIHGPTSINIKRAKELRYKCSQCLALFGFAENLRDHIQQQHHSRIQLENNSECISQQSESTSINQTIVNNWDNFSYPRSIRSTDQSH